MAINQSAAIKQPINVNEEGEHSHKWFERGEKSAGHKTKIILLVAHQMIPSLSFLLA